MKNTGVDDYWDVAPEGKRLRKMRDSKEMREVKSRRRVLKASLDLDTAVKNIVKEHKLRGWETVEVLQEMTFQHVNANIKTITFRDEKRARAKRKSARA